jgi:hypothetical protein
MVVASYRKEARAVDAVPGHSQIPLALCPFVVRAG